MTPMLTVLVVLVAAALAAVVVQLVRGARQERRVREELAAVRLALAEGQRDALGQVGGQLTGVIDRFHHTLAEFGQQVQTGQSASGEAVRQGLEEARRTLQAQLQGLVQSVNQQLARSQETVGQQFEGATKVFGELRGQLGHVAEMAVRMETLGREIEELQGILKAPKLRGQLGEATLEEFLRQVLPPDFFSLQYRFADGNAVDAVIHLRGHLVPVDAKFPLEAFQRLLAVEDEKEKRAARREFERAVKGRVDEIATKYIRPGERTFEFALMFIPAENIYYEVIVREGVSRDEPSLLNYAISRRVVPVSPNSFYAYLMTIATGLKGMQVEARAREILDELGRLQRDFGRFAESFRVLGRHISAAHGKYEEAETLASRFGDRLEGVAAQTEAPGLGDGGGAPLPAGGPED